MTKVCILAAGLGTRMGDVSHSMNKAILPLNGKAIISHIIEKFPSNYEFVIAVGYLKEQVMHYLTLAYPRRKFNFVEVKNYNCKGSGPGHSLLCCEHLLREPFYFIACDTLWEGDAIIEESQNWIGISQVSGPESERYCTVNIDSSGKVITLKDKELIHKKNTYAFIGLSFIKDYKSFWQGLKNKNLIKNELQVSNGLNALIEKNQVYAREIIWHDVGSEKAYKKLVNQFDNYDFSKINESIYIVNKKIIKFFSDANIASRRVQKARYKPDVFPKVDKVLGQFYSYKFIDGNTLYELNTPSLFKQLLKFLDKNVWIEEKQFSQSRIEKMCQEFYLKKTKERLNLFSKKYLNQNEIEVINGKKVKPVQDLIAQVPWPLLIDGIPSFIHGDLQFDNIIYAKNGKFILLDWRQDFAGEIYVGDMYYDLAKLAGGILLNYDLIKANKLTYSENSSGITFDFAIRFRSAEYFAILQDFVNERGLDFQKVELIMALIYLNMSPLHHYPFDKMLHALGRYLLQDWLENKNIYQ